MKTVVSTFSFAWLHDYYFRQTGAKRKFGSMHISQPTYYAGVNDCLCEQSALDKLLANMHLFCDGKHYMFDRCLSVDKQTAL